MLKHPARAGISTALPAGGAPTAFSAHFNTESETGK